jgi:hypothetical protein
MALHQFCDADCRFVSKKVGCVPIDLFDTRHKKVLGENRAEKRFGGATKSKCLHARFARQCGIAGQGHNSEGVGEVDKPIAERPRKLPKLHHLLIGA